MSRRALTGPRVIFGLICFAVFVWLVLFLCGVVGGDAVVAETSIQRAVRSMHTRDYAQAASAFREAAQCGGDKVLCFGGVAECQFYLGDYQRALNACDDLARVVPNAGRANHIRGLCFLKLGRQAEAAAEFRRAVRHGETLALTQLRKLGG